jgi:hypothetical protein
MVLNILSKRGWKEAELILRYSSFVSTWGHILTCAVACSHCPYGRPSHTFSCVQVVMYIIACPPPTESGMGWKMGPSGQMDLGPWIKPCTTQIQITWAYILRYLLCYTISARYLCLLLYHALGGRKVRKYSLTYQLMPILDVGRRKLHVKVRNTEILSYEDRSCRFPWASCLLALLAYV